MDAKKELQNKVKEIQKKIDACESDAQAILLQKEVIDLMKTAFQDKEFLKKAFAQNKK
jgi:hypothetical protein